MGLLGATPLRPKSSGDAPQGAVGGPALRQLVLNGVWGETPAVGRADGRPLGCRARLRGDPPGGDARCSAALRGYPNGRGREKGEAKARSSPRLARSRGPRRCVPPGPPFLPSRSPLLLLLLLQKKKPQRKPNPSTSTPIPTTSAGRPVGGTAHLHGEELSPPPSPPFPSPPTPKPRRRGRSAAGAARWSPTSGTGQRPRRRRRRRGAAG